MKNHFVSIALVVFFAPALSLASTQASLEAWLSSKVEFERCKDDPDGRKSAYIQAVFLEAVNIGIARLSEINPELVEERMSRFEERPTLVTCRAPSKGMKADRLNPVFLIRPSYVLRLGRILENPYHIQFNKRLAFHEFLHVMGFDNNHPKIHNDSPLLQKIDSDGLSGLEKDVVYSCAYTAFPNIKGMKGLKAATQSTQTKARILRASMARKTCESAKVIDGNITLELPAALEGISK